MWTLNFTLLRMYAMFGTKANKMYVEAINTGTKNLDLKNVWINDGSSVLMVFLDNLPPNSRLPLTAAFADTALDAVSVMDEDAVTRATGILDGEE